VSACGVLLIGDWSQYARQLLLFVIAAVTVFPFRCVTAVAAAEGAIAINLLEHGPTEPTIRVQTAAVSHLPLAVVAGHAFLQLRQVLDTIGTVTVDVKLCLFLQTECAEWLIRLLDRHREGPGVCGCGGVWRHFCSPSTKMLCLFAFFGGVLTVL